MQVTLLGTGTPFPNPKRRGPAYLFRVGDFRFQIDCGSGCIQRLIETGSKPADIDHLFLTHLHLDHYCDLGHWIVSRWMFGGSVPLKIFGPAGTKRLVDGLLEVHRPDIEMRRSIRSNPKPFPKVEVTEIEAGFVFQHEGLTVTPFDVSHFPLDQPFGYRCEASGRKIVFSGDTCPDDRLIDNARAADLLIHECVEYDKWRAKDIDPAHKALAHTDAEDFGRIAASAGVGLAVATHMLVQSKPAALAERIRAPYRGPLAIGEDLSTF
jgi:ribonuclease Z